MRIKHGLLGKTYYKLLKTALMKVFRSESSLRFTKRGTCDLHRPQCVVRVVESRGLRWAGHLTGIGKCTQNLGKETVWKMSTWMTEKEIGR
jgi:hypothetical protein